MDQMVMRGENVPGKSNNACSKRRCKLRNYALNHESEVLSAAAKLEMALSRLYKVGPEQVEGFCSVEDYNELVRIVVGIERSIL